MKILIVEDEKIASDRLKKMISQLLSEALVIDTADSVKSAVRWLSEQQADLMFLDIQLADGLSFEIFEKEQVLSPVIFTTSYDKYALRAFKVNSIDYLLKPIDLQELTEAIAKYKLRARNEQPGLPAAAVRAAFEMLKGKDFRERFAVRIGERIRLVDVTEVRYFESRDKTTFLASQEGRLFVLDQSLDQLESELDPKKFYRISRRHIVAMEAIGEIVVYSGSRLKVRLKEDRKDDLIVARERVGGFRGWIGQG